MKLAENPLVTESNLAGQTAHLDPLLRGSNLPGQTAHLDPLLRGSNLPGQTAHLDPLLRGSNLPGQIRGESPAHPSFGLPPNCRPVIETRGITKTYSARKDGTGGLTVLHPTWLSIFPQDQIAIVGPSGSGKSTLLSIIGTLEAPTTGSVWVEGRDTTDMKEWERSAIRSAHIGFIFQQFHLIPTQNAIENVGNGLLYAGVGAKERRARSVLALESVGLGHRLRHKPKEMSGGEQQRVAIARALVRNPAVLFADEPTGALDSKTGEAVVDLLADIAGKGTAVVVVTHDLAIAGQFARQIQIKDGVASENGYELSAPPSGIVELSAPHSYIVMSSETLAPSEISGRIALKGQLGALSEL